MATFESQYSTNMKEWVTLNAATGLSAILTSLGDNPILTLVGVISGLSLAFFNIMRGLKVYQEYVQAKTSVQPSVVVAVSKPKISLITRFLSALS